MYTCDKDSVIHVRIKNCNKDWLVEKANNAGVSVSDLVRYIINDYRRLEKHGDNETCSNY